jgi:hypothetical protein
MNAWANHEWKKRWVRTADGRTAATCRNTPWEVSPLTLYDNLPKHQTTAPMLLRTEVIGLNAWLVSIRVSDILPRCDCCWHAQTVRHVLMYCPKYEQQRADLIRATGSEDPRATLTHVASSQAAAQWFVRCGILDQFRVAPEIELEDVSEYAPFQALM